MTDIEKLRSLAEDLLRALEHQSSRERLLPIFTTALNEAYRLGKK